LDPTVRQCLGPFGGPWGGGGFLWARYPCTACTPARLPVWIYGLGFGIRTGEVQGLQHRVYGLGFGIMV